MASEQLKLSADEDKLIRQFRDLPEADKQSLLRTAEELVRSSLLKTIVRRDREPDVFQLAERVVSSRSGEIPPRSTQINLAGISFDSD